MVDEALMPGEAVAANPFDGTSQGFFIGGHRGRQLEELRHLSRWSRRLLAVTGDRGVGKSSLYRALSARLDTGVKAARINANLTSDTREVLHGLLQGFGVASPANANAQLLSQLITVHVEEQGEARRHCLVLVDDAHLLELRALEQLLQLVDVTSDDALRIVFFAESYFIATLDKATKRMTSVRAWHEIRLLPFNEEDTRAYLAYRLQEAGFGGRSPFTGSHLKLIFEQSGGLPGRINEIASALLNGDITIREEGRFLPRVHRALALLLIAGVAGAWLVWSSYQQRASTVTDSSDAFADETSASGAPATESLDLPAQTPAAPDVVATSPSAPIDAPKPQQGDVPPETPEPEPVATPASAPEPTVEAVKPVAAERPKVVVPETPKPVVAAKPAPKPVAAAPARGGPYGVEWVLDQPEGNYTLQLFGTSNKERWQAFIGRQKPGTEVASFETKRDGSPWYVVVFGSYPSESAAQAAARDLPSSIGKVEPWIRTFRSVRATIE